MNTLFLSATLLLIMGGICMDIWLSLRRKPNGNEDALHAAEERVTQLQNKLEQSQIAVGRAAELERANAQQRTQLAELTEKLEQAHQKLQQTEQEKIKVLEQKEALETMHAQQKANIEQLMSEQEKKFAALQEKSQSEFNRLTTESVLALKKQTEEAFKKSRTELQTQNSTLLTPLKDTMTKFSGALETFKESSISRHAELKNALTKTLAMNETLSKEAENLTNALKAPKIQGNWGELTLEEVLTSGGLMEGVNYDKQVYLNSESGKQYPDFIVHLPQDRHIIIDSKMSINSYVKWCNAATDEERKEYITQHVAAIRKHIDELSTKEYQKQLAKQNLEFVLMFIPIEYAYFAALQENPSLNELARKHHIYIVTASNLLTVLQIAEHLWRQERSGQLTEKIFKTAQDMHERVGRFLERMQDLETKIAGVQKSYMAATKSLTGPQSILTSAKQLEALRIKSAKELPVPEAEDAFVLPQDSTL